MKKIMALLLAAICLTLTGCNSFAREEYNSEDIIAEDDRHTAFGFDQTDYSYNSFTWKALSFDGRATLWTIRSGGDCQQNANVKLCSSKGQAKLVLVDGYGNVTTLAECGEGNETVFVDTPIPLTWGENRLKLVGYDCKGAGVRVTINNDPVDTSSV